MSSIVHIRHALRLYELLTQSETGQEGKVHTASYIRYQARVKHGLRHYTAVQDLEVGTEETHIYLGIIKTIFLTPIHFEIGAKLYHHGLSGTESERVGVVVSIHNQHGHLYASVMNADLTFSRYVNVMFLY
jgi:hypothetical protein